MLQKLIRIFPLTLITAILVSSCAVKNNQEAAESNGWDKMYAILGSVKEPVFNNKTYKVTDFGAVADGKTSNTVAFKNTIEKCAQQGGGTVAVPAGKYFTGPIHLESNVNLHLQEGAELLFSTNPADYPLVHTSWEGTELMNFSPLIYAYKKNNIAVTGKGTINGQATVDNWWPWAGKGYGFKKGMPSQADPLNRPRLVQLAEDGVPADGRIFGEGHYLRPSFVEFFECTNAMIKDIKILNAPFWVIHPIKSTNVIVDGVTITSHGPNNDGCDPEYCKNVVIRNCSFNTGDDCIAIKSGRDGDGRRVNIPSENIVVQNCKMFDGHGGVTIGSEISAGVRNVFVENCIMDSPELDRAIRIKSNTRRGGFVENLYVRNVQVGQVKESVLGIDMFYSIHGNQTGNYMPHVQNILLENVTVKNGGDYGILAKGIPAQPINSITFKNVVIEKVKTEYKTENVENLRFIDTKINGAVMQSPGN